MKQKISLIYLVFVLVLSLKVQGQVTIGSVAKPNEGALLDLKENNLPNENSTKGLLLPRVELTDEYNLYPMLPKGYDKSVEDIAHTGLIVYNTIGCFQEGAGLYVWTGDAWNYLAEKNVPDLYSFKDQNGNSFLARKFGDAGIWMVQNLAATTYDPIRDSYDTNIQGSTIEDKDFKYPGGKSKELTTDKYPWMGVLYNFATATNHSINSVNSQRIQGICPNGWHVPSTEEWGELENEIIRNTNMYSTLIESYLSTGMSLQDTPKKDDNYKYSYEAGKNFMPALLDPCPLPDTKTSINGVSLKASDGGFALRLVGGLKADGSVDGYGTKAGFWVASRTINKTTGAPDPTGRNRVYIADANPPTANNNGGDPSRYYAVRCKKNEN